MQCVCFFYTHYTINSADIETYVDCEKNYIPYCLCCFLDGNYYSFYIENKNDNIIERFVSFLFEKKKNYTIYVHNLDFDGILIISYITRLYEKYEYGAFVRSGSFYNIQITNKESTGTVKFVCSYKIFPLSLKKIAPDFTIYKKKPFPYLFSSYSTLNYKGKIPGIEYWNDAEDLKNYLKNNTQFDFKKYSIEYCTNDVSITAAFMLKISKITKEFDINIESVVSGPSLALKIFIKKFNKNRISFKNSELHDKLCRQAYFGGRCEVYGNPYKDDLIFHFDFSGMYAQCMLEKFAYGSFLIKTADADITKPGFYWIIFDSNLKTPVLPIHDIVNGKLMFVNGENIQGCYWFEEISLFLKEGGIIKKVLYGVEYNTYKEVFDEYSFFFSNLRKQGGAYSLFGKNMNNFLYGRMGITDPEEFTFFSKKKELNFITKFSSWDIVAVQEVNNLYMITVKIDNSVIKHFNIKKNKFKKNVAIAAAITSKARIKLYLAQRDVEKNEGRVLYSDTDSIFAAFKKNVIGERHGEVYWDQSKADTAVKNAVFISAKTYGILAQSGETKIKIKGFDSKVFSYEELEKNFYKNKSLTKKIKTIRKSNFSLKQEEISKFLNLHYYDKRIFLENKKTTIPVKI